MVWQLLLLGIASYLLGSVNFGVIVGKLCGVDVRQQGSGNPGATNVSRVLGIGPGMAVLVLDGLKGLVAALSGAYVFTEPFYALLMGLLAVIGHNWPLYYRFKGGKGVATTIGVFLAVSPWLLLISGLVTVAVIAVTRYVSLGSLCLSALLVILFPAAGRSWQETLLVLIVALLVFWRHRSNIRRLLQGRENRFGKGGKT